MANDDTRFGLRPVNGVQAGPYNGRVSLYYAPSSYATAIYVGDPVTTTGNSNASALLGFGPRMLHEVNVTAVGDGNAITGVVLGVIPTTGESTVYGAASTNRLLLVNDDPYAVFEIQADGSVAADDVGLNAVLIATHTGSTVTGLSGMELDTTSDVPAADASNQLTILGFVNREDNDPTSANPKVLVRINNHTNAHASIGIA